MIPALLENGLLPLGRYASTIEEVESRFAPADHPFRYEMWSDWIKLTELIHDTVGELPAVWLGGSFITSKDEPGDIDSVYILKRETILQLPDFNKSVLDVLVDDIGQSYTGAVSPYFVYIDEMIDHTTACKNGDATSSLLERGYWDQLWSRTRDCLSPAYPICGYLEVIIDGYQ